MGDTGKAILGLVGAVLVVVWVFAVFSGGRRDERKELASEAQGPAAAVVAPAAGETTIAAKPTTASPERVSEQAGYDSFIVMKTKDAVKARLRDPESARFSDVRVGVLQGTKVVCGYVNGANAFGGKVGRQRFIGLGETTFLEEEGAEAVDSVWTQACRS